jgi:hypothetical protein
VERELEYSIVPWNVIEFGRVSQVSWGERYLQKKVGGCKKVDSILKKVLAGKKVFGGEISASIQLN